MGLNDDVDDGLLPEDTPEVNENQPIPDTIVFTPNQNADSVIDQENYPTTDELFGVGAVERELPNFNAEFALSKESYYKAADLFFYKQCIAKSNGICKEDAEVLNQMDPGFINETKPIGFFTEEKSRTQLNESMNNINVSLDSKYTTLLKTVNDSIVTYHSTLSPIVSKMDESVFDIFSKVQSKIADTAKNINETELGLNADLRNFLDFNLGNSFDDEIKLTGSSIEGVKRFLSSPKNRQNIRAILDGAHFEYKLKLFTRSFNENFYEVIDDNEFLKKTEVHPNDLPEPYFYKILSDGVNPFALSYCTALVGCGRNLLTKITNSKQDIENLNNIEEDFKTKLDCLFKIHSENTNAYLNIVSLLTFVCDYVDFINEFSNVVTELLNKK